MYLTAWGRMVRQACSAWHFTSEQEAQHSWPLDDSPRFVVPNGVEPEEYAVDREEARRRVWRGHGELNNSPYVLFLGRLHPKKRLDVLIPAFLESVPQPFKLVVAGPDELNLWEKLAARFLKGAGAVERVVRIGTVGGREKVWLLAGATLFALPSEHENFGVAALEALAAGTPTLLSPHVDLAHDAIASGISYTAPIDIETWGARLADLLTRIHPLAEAAHTARRWVRDHFSWAQVANQLIERYNWVMAGRDDNCVENRPFRSNRCRTIRP
jgi:glycosyltransferase involved in cell wall biosynthesis